MTQTRRFSRIAFILVFAASIANAQEPSLAEQAAAARAARSASVSTPAAGARVARGDYYNEALGLHIRRIPGWTSMSVGEMNVDEAIGRQVLGLQPGMSPSLNRVFGLHDEEGSNVQVMIVPMPGATSDPVAVKAMLKAMFQADIPGARVVDEPILLGDDAHRFVGLRGTHTIANREITQSLQMVIVQGHAIAITATALSAEKIDSLLPQLRAAISWTQPSAAQ